MQIFFVGNKESWDGGVAMEHDEYQCDAKEKGGHSVLEYHLR